MGHRRRRCHVPASGLQQRCTVGIDPEVQKCWIGVCRGGGESTRMDKLDCSLHSGLSAAADCWCKTLKAIYALCLHYHVLGSHGSWGIKSMSSYNKGEQLEFLTVYQYVTTVLWNALFLTQWLSVTQLCCVIISFSHIHRLTFVMLMFVFVLSVPPIIPHKFDFPRLCYRKHISPEIFRFFRSKKWKSNLTHAEFTIRYGSPLYQPRMKTIHDAVYWLLGLLCFCH